MQIQKIKNRGLMMIVSSVMLIAVFTVLSIPSVFSSATSTNYSVNDEDLDFAYNADYLQAPSFNMDLSTVSWVARPMESASYKIIDSNSDLDPTPVVLPTPGGGTSPPSAGGRDIPDDGEIDNAVIVEKDQFSFNLHPAPEEKPELNVRIEDPYEPYIAYNPPVYSYGDDDTDDCSAHFENIFMKTNPNRNDSDNDGVEDCDEYLVYGLNPHVFNENHDNTGLARPDFIYTQMNPFLVGRSTLNTEDFENALIQMHLTKISPVTDYGLFFLNLQDDYNFADISPISLDDGVYESAIIMNGKRQDEVGKFVLDSAEEFEPLHVDSANDNILETYDGLVKMTGKTGKRYGVVAIWEGDLFVDVSAVVSDKNGYYAIYAPRAFDEGSYSVTLYGLVEKEEKVVQTNYKQFNFVVEEGVVYMVEETQQKEIILHLKSSYEDLQADMVEFGGRSSNFFSLVSFSVFLLFALITFFAVCKKRR